MLVVRLFKFSLDNNKDVIFVRKDKEIKMEQSQYIDNIYVLTLFFKEFNLERNSCTAYTLLFAFLFDLKKSEFTKPFLGVL